MEKQTYYRLDSKGKVREWSIEVIFVDDSLSRISILAGIKNGKMIPTVTDITSGLNLGKSNETTVYEQAVKDAQSEINKHIKQGYVSNLNNLKEAGETATIKKPMKGDKYHPNGKNKAKTLDDLKIRNKKVIVQRKLDGFRFRIFVDNETVIFYSSSGDIVPPFPQIEKSIRDTYNKIYNDSYPDGLMLDGEVYRHQFDEEGNPDEYGGFANVSSACGTKVHITPEKQLLRDKMQFYLFDVYSDKFYEERYKIIQSFASETVKVVENHYVIANEEEIEELFNKFLGEGYEGLMIRTIDQPYEHKRSKRQLTKYKPLVDAEFKIVGFKQSISGETLGSLKCEMDNGKTFYANLKSALGSDKVKKQIWDNKDEYIGKYVTVEYLELTPELPNGEGGLPRHPRAKALRKGKSID